MNYSSDYIIKDLTEKFNEFAFEYDEVSYSGTIPVFFIQVNCNETVFSEKWSRIVDFIGINFQTSLDNEFSVWNLYLFFIAANGVSESLKYIIENNTFSSRKIVIDTLMSNDEIIKDHIINSDLSFGDVSKQSAVFEYNEIIAKYLKDKESKKKITEEDRTTFKKISSAIKKQTNEN